tara:strand:+ start:1486 stop:1803 length:318 start_codon:yes stop_codon:yes gene_type:complete
MATGSESYKKEIISKIKIGDYLKWKPLPINLIEEEAFAYFKGFVGIGNDWQYGLVLDILQCPRHENDKESIQGIHIQLLKNGEIDWIFNFELFNEIEIIGKLDED